MLPPGAGLFSQGSDTGKWVPLTKQVRRQALGGFGRWFITHDINTTIPRYENTTISATCLGICLWYGSIPFEIVLVVGKPI